MKNFTRSILLLILFFSSVSISIRAQVSGDFRSKSSGNWGNYITWQVYNGTTWVDATVGQFPGGTIENDANNVYIEAAHTVTLESNHSCKDLHLNSASDVVRINTQNYTLDVWGKMRYYQGLAPGSNTTAPAILGWISTGASGSIRFRGTANRIIMADNQVNSNNNNSGWNMDFAFDPGIIGEVNEKMRASTITVTSGIIVMNDPTGEFRVGTNGGAGDFTPDGSFTIKSGATVMMGGAGIFKKSNVAAQSFTLESGANLIVTQPTFILAAVNLTLNGTVTLQNAINFPNITGREATATPVNTFNNLILEGSGAKSLVNNITVNGKLTMKDTASLSSGSFSLAYGSSAELEYSGSSAQVSTDSEFPSSNGPSNLIINNSNGVTLHESRIISNQLTLTSGLLILGNNDLTLGDNSPSIAGSPSVTNMIVTNGTGKLIKNFSAAGTFLYPVGDTTDTDEYSPSQLTINSATTFDGTTYFGTRVVDNEHPSAAASSDKISRYWEVITNMSGYSYDANFQYQAADVNGTESNIKSFLFTDETSSSNKKAINAVNSGLHQIQIAGQNEVGFVSAVNFGCSITNNSIITGNSAICLGQSLSIDASVANVLSNNPQYQWQVSKDGGAWMNVGNSEDYTLSDTTSVGQYSFQRIVSDPINCLPSEANISNELIITVNPLTTIVQSPATKTICSGINTTFNVIANGANLNYQWQVSTGGSFTNLSESQLYTNVTGSTLNIINAPYSLNNYRYRCTVSGSCGPTVISNTATLKINAPATVLTHPNNASTCNSTEVSFSVSGTGLNLLYQWQYSKDGGTTFINVPNTSPYIGTTTSNLTITTAPASFNNYIYRCKLSASCSSIAYSNNATLTVGSNTVNITLQPAGKTICPGTSTSLSISASGSTTVNYQWQVSTDGGISFTNINNDAIYSNVTSSILNITNAVYLLNGNKYRCIISGSCAASKISNAVNLQVYEPATVLSNPNDVTVCANSPASFSVVGSGENATYQWQVSSNGGTSFVNVPNTLPYSNAKTATLNISSTPSSFNGYIYRCKITASCATSAFTNNVSLFVDCGARFAFSETELDSSPSISIYPNPFNEEANINLNGFKDNVTVSVKNLDGKIFLIKENHPYYENIVLGNELSPGVYIIEIRNNSEFQTHKIVKTE